MIKLLIDEHCPFCTEDLEIEVEQGDVGDYTCDCGATAEINITTTIAIDFTRRTP